jgi:uncharacterized protein YndB with AHSA1/START domain
MLIRKPAAEVFEAMVDPQITRNFWFTRGSGRLEQGEVVTWDWEMYGVSAELSVRSLEQNARVVFDWQGATEARAVEWLFTPHGDESTFVAVRESGFVGNPEELIAQVADSAQGFSLMLAGLKAFLEHGLQLGLVGDRHPGNHPE